MRRICGVLAMVAFMGVGVAAAQAPDSSAPVDVELITLLKEFLAGAARNDAAAHNRFWTEDLVYTGSAGRRIGKADILRDVRSAPGPAPGDPMPVYTAEDIRIQPYGGTSIVAFRLAETITQDRRKAVNNYLNTGTFLATRHPPASTA